MKQAVLQSGPCSALAGRPGPCAWAGRSGSEARGSGSRITRRALVGRRFAATLLPRLFGTRKNPRSHHTVATGRVRTGDQLLPFYAIANLDKTVCCHYRDLRVSCADGQPRAVAPRRLGDALLRLHCQVAPPHAARRAAALPSQVADTGLQWTQLLSTARGGRAVWSESAGGGGRRLGPRLTSSAVFNQNFLDWNILIFCHT